MIAEEECRDVLSIVRLRNLLVHRYWVIDDAKIYSSVKKDFKRIVSVVRKVRGLVGA